MDEEDFCNGNDRSIASKHIFAPTEGSMGVPIGEDILYFADDPAISVQDEVDAHYMVRKLQKYDRWRLKIDLNNKEYTV